MIDLERTYRIRRAICRVMQQSQKAESQIAERSKQIAVKGKHDILVLLSAWLLDLKSASAISEAEQTAVQNLTQMSLEKWIRLQAVAMQIEKDLNKAERDEKEAIASLQQKAPYGAATRLLTDAESKSQIKVLQNNVAAAQKYRESLLDALKENVGKRQRLGETFLRDCLSQKDQLASTPVLGIEVKAILSHMT